MKNKIGGVYSKHRVHKNAYIFQSGNLKGRDRLGEWGYKSVNWIKVAYCTDQRRALVNTIEIFGSHKI
jgi:hypothetical protein